MEHATMEPYMMKATSNADASNTIDGVMRRIDVCIDTARNDRCSSTGDVSARHRT